MINTGFEGHTWMYAW